MTRPPVLMRSARCAVVAMACLVASGCSTPAATERFYALSDGMPSGAAPAAAGAAGAPGIVITAVTVPELVDRPQIVTRDGMNRINVSEQNQWAEPVKSGIGRVVAGRLSRSLAAGGMTARVAAYPQTSIGDPDLRITIDVQRFDATPGGDAVIEALWTVRRNDGRVRSGRTVATQPVRGVEFEEAVRAWSSALDGLDRDIAAAVLQVGIAPRGATSR